MKSHHLYIAKIQEVTLDAADNSGPISDTQPLQKEQGDTNITIDSLDMCTNREMVDQDDDDLAKERDLLTSLIEKLKCEIDDSKNRNKFLESLNKNLIDKLKGEIEDFKTKNKSLESSNNHFKEANNELSKTNQLMFKDLKKFQAELDRYHDVTYALKMEINCAKAKGDLMSYKMESQKSLNEHTRKINDLNQMISKMKKELVAHQETISIMSQEKEDLKKFHKTCEDKELEKVIALENKIKILDDIVHKIGQSVQTMNMLNRNCKTSFVKPEFLKKAQRANPCLYDIGCYNDNLALMLASESDKTIRLAHESRSKLSDLIKPFDYKNLNNLYDLFVPQREKSLEHRYFSERCSNHMTGNLKLLSNFVEQFLGTMKFGNDQIQPILGYGDLVQGNVTIKRVYYVKGLNHNLFSVGSHGIDLYYITLQDTSTPNPICLMAKASSSQAWLWHCHLSHLNLDTINLLLKYDIVTGLPKLKFFKDHLCSYYELGKAKRKSSKTKTAPRIK
ncbi:integrase, catalytic region, zinc finger, CCHC-type containing protein [Tanacetum coccineum]